MITMSPTDDTPIFGSLTPDQKAKALSYKSILVKGNLIFSYLPRSQVSLNPKEAEGWAFGAPSPFVFLP